MAVLLFASIQATGEVAVSGDVDPPDPADWPSARLISIGLDGIGQVSVLDGVTLPFFGCRIGKNAGSSGTLTIDGPATTWPWADYMTVGSSGQGTLNITNGAAIYCQGISIGSGQGSVGHARVDGAGSSLKSRRTLKVGHAGQGRLDIDNDAAAEAELVQIQGDINGRGEIHLDGGTLRTLSLWCPLESLSGRGGIETHGLVSDRSLIFDSPDDLTQTISLSDLLQITMTVDGQGDLGAGYLGRASLTIANGINVAANSIYLGYHPGSHGSADIAGPGTTLTCGVIFVGRKGQAELHLRDGARIVSDDGVFIGDYTESKGMALVEGPETRWTSENFIYVGSGLDSELTVRDGAQIVSNGISMGTDFVGNGILTVEGRGSSLTSTWDLDIGGYVGTGQAHLRNGAALIADDELTIDRLDNGQSFLTMTTGGMLAIRGEGLDTLGAFLAAIQGHPIIRYRVADDDAWRDITTASPGVDYILAEMTDGRFAGHCVLAVSPLAADANLDGGVDIQDFISLKRNYGLTIGATWEQGDFNHDGQTDMADFVILKQHYGESW